MTFMRHFLSGIFENRASAKNGLDDFYTRTKPAPLSWLPDEKISRRLVEEIGPVLTTLQSASRPDGRHDFSTATHASMPGTVWVECHKGQDRLSREVSTARYASLTQALETNMLEIRILPDGHYQVTDFSTVETFNEGGHSEHRRHKVHKQLDAVQVTAVLVDFAKRATNLDLDSSHADSSPRAFHAPWALPPMRAGDAIPKTCSERNSVKI